MLRHQIPHPTAFLKTITTPQVSVSVSSLESGLKASELNDVEHTHVISKKTPLIFNKMCL